MITVRPALEKDGTRAWHTVDAADLERVLGVTRPGMADLAVCVLGSLVLVAVIEAEKARQRRPISPTPLEVFS